MLNRRNLLQALSAGSLAAMVPAALQAAPVNRVVVVGGGMAGAAVAKYLRLWSKRTVDVTLVESASQYVSNIMSNLVVTGQYAASTLNYNWSNLSRNHGVKVVNGTVMAVEPGGSLGGW